LEFAYRGARILTNPPPSAGGVLLALTLKTLEALDVASLEPGSSEHLQALLETMTAVNDGRARADGDLQQLLQIYREQVAATAQISRGTTHISIMDATGNHAAMTLSNGEGCGHLIADTGIMLNNMLGEEDINPAGIGKWPLNSRLGSMMAPTLIEGSGVHHALGSGGSKRICSALTQVISQLQDFQATPEKAVHFPRAHFEDNLLSVEAGFETGDLSASWDGLRIQPWDSLNLFFGGVHLASLREGEFEATGDPRRGGVGRLVIA
jgi:gamma-glutamyltranspeptidase/glutathione hydrolase